MKIVVEMKMQFASYQTFVPYILSTTTQFSGEKSIVHIYNWSNIDNKSLYSMEQGSRGKHYINTGRV